MGKETRTIHITKALSYSMIGELFDEYPNLEEITCSPSVYNRTSRKYIEALSEMGINVKKKYEWGAKSQTEGVEFEVFDSNSKLIDTLITNEAGEAISKELYIGRYKVKEKATNKYYLLNT